MDDAAVTTTTVVDTAAHVRAHAHLRACAAAELGKLRSEVWVCVLLLIAALMLAVWALTASSVVVTNDAVKTTPAVATVPPSRDPRRRRRHLHLLSV